MRRLLGGGEQRRQRSCLVWVQLQGEAAVGALDLGLICAALKAQNGPGVGGRRQREQAERQEGQAGGQTRPHSCKTPDQGRDSAGKPRGIVRLFVRRRKRLGRRLDHFEDTRSIREERGDEQWLCSSGQRQASGGGQRTARGGKSHSPRLIGSREPGLYLC